MAKDNIGAGILNIITESLYDKPIVVFREYVQNCADSLSATMQSVDKKVLSCKIWSENNNLFFLDNGNGIDEDKFLSEMRKIAYSGKKRTVHIGYKGIGRLSGISYCEKLIFINIVSYKKKHYQVYSIDCCKYSEIKKRDDYNALSFDELMDQIGVFDDKVTNNFEKRIIKLLNDYKDMFLKRDKGFLVIMEGFNSILEQLMSEKTFFGELGWLLPVNFEEELYETKQQKLFEELSKTNDDGLVPAMGFDIYYNNKLIKRPITSAMLRDYTCICDFKYAVGFHTFRQNKFVIEKGNYFAGIRIYIDNMLLCDEAELIPILREYGLLEHSVNELVQSVRAIGAVIYITDKINISANARRTFIEVTNEETLDFLGRLAEFIERIYKARYALSKYSSGKKNQELEKGKLDELRQKANEGLRDLAEEEIKVDNEEDGRKQEFDKLSDIEKKQIIKKKIAREFNEKIRIYLSQVTQFDYNNAYEDFKIWMMGN